MSDELQNETDGSCAMCCATIDGDGVIAGLQVFCRSCAGKAIESLERNLASMTRVADSKSQLESPSRHALAECESQLKAEREKSERLRAAVIAAVQILKHSCHWSPRIKETTLAVNPPIVFVDHFFGVELWYKDLERYVLIEPSDLEA